MPISQQTATWQTPHTLFHSLGLQAHPVRYQLSKMPQKPTALEIKAPCHVIHIATQPVAQGYRSEGYRLMEWARHHNLTTPTRSYEQLTASWGKGQLSWYTLEGLHLYTIVVNPDDFKPFDQEIFDLIPADLFPIVGQVYNAQWLSVLPPSSIVPPPDDVERLCEGKLTLVSGLMDNALSLWSPGQPHPCGFTRFLVQPCDLDPLKIGGVVSTLCEAESLRLLIMSQRPSAEDQTALLKAEIAKLAAFETPSPLLSYPDILARVRGLMDSAATLEKQKRTILQQVNLVHTLGEQLDGLTKAWMEGSRYGYLSYSEFVKRSFAYDAHVWKTLHNDCLVWLDHIQRLGLLLHTQALNLPRA